MFLTVSIAAVIWYFLFAWRLVAGLEETGVRNLTAHPDYRTVNLKWNWIQPEDIASVRAFQVHYCELQTWGSHRCQTKSVPDKATHSFVSNNKKAKSYSADIDGLRMATTYSFEVRPLTVGRDDRANEKLVQDTDLNNVIIPTKGFSARATLCLPSVSEVDVETGPHFGGRISVENTEGKDKCSTDGDSESARDVYTLRIDHKECGSEINGTTVATYITVQENLPILTHSTRRFLVLCTFKPDTLTVKAGINLPHGSSQIEPLPYEDMINEVRHQRQIAVETAEKPKASLLLMSILVLCSTFSIIAFFIIRQHRRRLAATSEHDTMSITSSSTERSYSDTESVSTVSGPIVKPQDGDVFTIESTSGTEDTRQSSVLV